MSKQISTKTLKELYKNVENEVTIVIGKIGEVEIEMIVKKTLSMQDFGSFVLDLSGAEFAGDEYLPQGAKIIFAVRLVEYYTNANLPKDIEAAYEIVSSLGLEEKVLRVINGNQYSDLLQAINSAQLFTKTQKTGLSGLLTTIKKSVEQFDMKDILTALQGFSPEQLQNLAELKDLAKIFTAKQQPVVEAPNIISFSPAEEMANGEDEE